MEPTSPPAVGKETRDRIFAAAAKLFAARGYGSVSMREIAEAAEVSKPMLYYYFENKAGLCRALLEEGFQNLSQTWDEIARLDIPLIERFRRVVRAQFRHVRENPDLVRFHINFLLGPDEAKLAAEFRREHKPIVNILLRMFAEGQASGLFRSDINPSVAINVFSGAVNIHVGQSILLGGPPLDDDLADQLTQLYLHGVCA